MAGRIVGTLTTHMEQSIQRWDGQWFHVRRTWRKMLHSTKGWRKAGSDKTIEAVERPIRHRAMVTQTFERTR